MIEFYIAEGDDIKVGVNESVNNDVCVCVCTDQPIISWLKATESNRPILLVRWCRSRPSVFFVLDSDSYLYIWDLNMDDAAALKYERISPHARCIPSLHSNSLELRCTAEKCEFLLNEIPNLRLNTN